MEPATLTLEEAQTVLANIEAQMQQMTRARNGIPLEGETLPAYDRAKAIELKAQHTAQSRVVTELMLGDPTRKVNRSVGGDAYQGMEDKRGA